MSRDSFLICFAGIDGSGKTTLAEALADMLEDNVRGRYIWCGWRQFESFALMPLAKVIKALFRFSKKDSSDNQINSLKTRFPLIFQNLILFDHFLCIWTKLGTALISGKNIICDRYVYDTVVDISLDFGYSEAKANSLVNTWLRFLPKPSIVFWVDTPAELAYQRKQDFLPIHYLSAKQEIYRAMSQRQKMLTLDGSKSLAELKELVYNKVIDYMAGIK